MAFDKTGTLTIGRFKLLSCHPEGISEAEFLEYAAASEAISNHPIAACLKSLSPFDQSQVSSAVDMAGEGVKAIYKGHEVFAGKAKEGDSPKQEGTAVSLYIDGRLLPAWRSGQAKRKAGHFRAQPSGHTDLHVLRR